MTTIYQYLGPCPLLLPFVLRYYFTQVYLTGLRSYSNTPCHQFPFESRLSLQRPTKDVLYPLL